MQNVKMPRLNWSSVANRSSAALIVGFSLAMSTAIAGMNAANATPKNALTQQPTSPQAATLADGIYLYGQSDKPDELGKGYFVFEATKGQVVGALYYPRSSFDCAAGRFTGDQLALTVTNSYDRATNPFEIALDRTSTVASNGKPIPAVGLQGFYKLDQVTDNDLRMLNVCKADLQGQGQTKAAR